MSLDQPSFNQNAYLPKQRGTIIHSQPWPAPRLRYHQSTSSQTIASQQIQHGVVLFIFEFSQKKDKDKRFAFFVELI